MSKKTIDDDIKKDKNTNNEQKDDWFGSILIAVIAAVIIRIFIFAPTIVVGPSMEPTLQGPDSVPSFFNITNDRLIAERLSYFLKVSPERGQIITFSEPSSDFYAENNSFRKLVKFLGKKDYIKRVIGIGGDHIKIKGDVMELDGRVIPGDYEVRDDRLFINGQHIEGDHDFYIGNAKVYVNGQQLQEEYVNGPWDVVVRINDGRIQMDSDRDVNIDLTVPQGYVYVMGDNRNYSFDSRKFSPHSPSRKSYRTENGCISLKELSGRVVFRFWPTDGFGVIKD